MRRNLCGVGNAVDDSSDNRRDGGREGEKSEAECGEGGEKRKPSKPRIGAKEPRQRVAPLTKRRFWTHSFAANSELGVRPTEEMVTSVPSTTSRA